MKSRFVARLALSLGLIAALAVGCSRSGDEAQKTAPVRPLSAIWPEVLAQRDTMQALMTKPLEEVTHEDCSALGAAARKVDELTGEILSSVPTILNDEGRLRAIGDVIIRMQGVMAKIRESALSEAPGLWIQLRFPLDQTLRGFESYFTAEEIGGGSVTGRPNFETKPPPASLSPI